MSFENSIDLFTTKSQFLVIGAGASGLAFALTCATAGVRVRIVEKRPRRSTMGKATGVALGVWYRNGHQPLRRNYFCRTMDLKKRFADADLKYERHFRVSLRRVPTPRIGNVWLIGDAAHVQSPVGGQGLSLAIWDGITLADALLNNDLEVEKRLASRARFILFFTDVDYRMLATRVWWLRRLRNAYWSFASRHPSAAKWFFKIISGVW